jgi:hypothetical protein
MSNLNCKYIKLSNGENIICLTDDNMENLETNRRVLITDPMMVSLVRVPRLGVGVVDSYVLHPWMPLSEDKIMEINTSCIISAVEAKASFREQYENFIDQMNNEKLIPAEERETARDLSNAQELMKALVGDMDVDLDEILEEQEDDDDSWLRATGTGRTLH